MTLNQAPTAALRALAGEGASAQKARAFFDSLPPVQVGELAGYWRGSALDPGNPFGQLLSALRWYGKRFDGAEAVHPLVFEHKTGLYSVNPAFVPVRIVVRFSNVLRGRLISAAGRRIIRAARTSAPKARLRPVEHHGVVTATMIYDALPILDSFRRVSDDELLGVMDLRGADPFFFVLQRDRTR